MQAARPFRSSLVALWALSLVLGCSAEDQGTESDDSGLGGGAQSGSAGTGVPDEGSGGRDDGVGGSTQSAGGRIESQGGRVESVGGSVPSSGGRVEALGGAVQTSGGRVENQGGRTDASGGRVDASGGAVQANGGLGEALGGAVEASGGHIDGEGGVIDAQGGHVESNGGQATGEGGHVEATGGQAAGEGGHVEAAGGQATGEGGESPAQGGSGQAGAAGAPAAQGLGWPIECDPDVDCNIFYPDIDEDGVAFDCGDPGYQGHQGTDISITWEKMDEGTDVYAADAGEVLWVFDGHFDRCPDSTEPTCQEPTADMSPGVESGYMVCTDASDDYCLGTEYTTGCYFCFYGSNVVVIRHPEGSVAFATRYDHLRRDSILVEPGQVVERGEKIAEVGSAGNSTGPHLHFEVWVGGYYRLAEPWAGTCGPNQGPSLWDPALDLPGQ